jgi:spore germination protein YaaH
MCIRDSTAGSPPYLAVLGLAVAGVLVVVATTGFGGANGPSGSGPHGSDPSATRPVTTPRPTPVPIPGHEVYGFLPYWEMIDGISAHLAETRLTTLGLFSVTHRRNGTLATGQAGYKRIVGPIGERLIAEAHERGVRVELVYTSFGYQKNADFLSDLAIQARTIDGLVALVRELGLDGVNVDIEQLQGEFVPAYGVFVEHLRTALREADPDAQVSVATGANYGGAAMAVAATAAGADRIFLMGYDYHWSGSAPGASAPLDRRDGDGKDLRWSLDLYHTLGVPAERTLLGLPLYGMAWPVVSDELGAPRTGRGAAWIPRRNLDFLADPSHSPLLDPIEVVEFHAVEREDGWLAVYVDSPRTLAPKLLLADERGLAGAGLWALGYERGLPEMTELIATFHAGELTGSGSTIP